MSYIEGLRCLHHTVVAAEHVLAASVLVDVAQGICHGIYRDGSVFLACRLEAFLDNLFRYEWANAVVDAHYAILVVWDECQSVFGRMEAGFTAIGYLVLDVEVILLAELVPVCLLALWQNQDDAQLWVVLMKARWCASG